VLYVAFRHKFKLLAVFSCVFAAVLLYTYVAQEIYRSESKVLIRLGRENLSVDPSVSGPTLYSSRDRVNEVNSELAILGSRALAEQVVDTLGAETFLEKPDEEVNVEPPVESLREAQQELRALRREVRQTEDADKGLLVALDLVTPLTPREKAIKYVMKNTSVAVEPKTDIISVSFDAPSRDLARDALAALIEFYQERHIEVHSAQATPRFFEEQTQQHQDRLNRCEAELAAFREAHGITSMEKQKEVMLLQVSDLEKQLAESIAQLEATRQRIASLDKTLKGRSKTLEISRTTGVTNFAADALKEKLLDLRLRETDLSARYPATHRPLIDIRQQIQEAEAALARENETHTEITTGVDETYQSLRLTLENEQAQAAATEARRAALERELIRQKAEVARLTGCEVQLAALEREVALAEKDYEQYRESLQRARISTALDLDKVSNVSVVQPATLPIDPVKPNKLLNIAIGVFLAMFAAISFAFTVEYFDDSVNSAEQIEKWVGVPVLITVSHKEYKACI